MGLRKYYDDVGDVIGYLTLKTHLGKTQCARRKREQLLDYWLCVCVCGKELVKDTEALHSKTVNKKSCGCKHFIRNFNPNDPKSPSYHGLFTRLRAVAKGTGKEWHLSFDEFMNFIVKECHYCKVPPSRTFNVYKTKKGNYRSRNKEWCDKAEIEYSGLDRIDSKKGYIPGNIVPCCPTCNWAKNDLSYEKFIIWVKRIGKVWLSIEYPAIKEILEPDE